MPDSTALPTPVSYRARGRTRRRLHRLAAGLLGAVLLAAGLGAPAGAAGTMSGQRASQPPADRFVTLGDSYSSGEGLFAYDPATDVPDNRCHRSPYAYGPLLAAVADQPFDFAACSGAVTSDFYRPNHRYPVEPPQLTAVDRRTATVTLTIGGNDAGFVAVLAACLRARALSGRACATERPEVVGAARTRIRSLTGRPVNASIVPVPKILGDLSKAAPGATIYVGGYPQLFGSDPRGYTGAPVVGGNGTCTLVSTPDPRSDLVISYADARLINQLTTELNRVLLDSVFVARARGAQVRWVPATSFTGHGLCETGDAESWLNPVLPTFDSAGRLTLRPESVHPNFYGNLGYTLAFWAAMHPGQQLPGSVRRAAAAATSAEPTRAKSAAR